MLEGDVNQYLQNLRQNIESYLSFLGIAALAAACRSFLSEDRRSFKGWMRGIVLAVFAAYLTGSALEPYGLDPGTYKVLVGVSGFVADDILTAILKATKAMLNNPREAISTVVDAILKRDK